MLVLMCNDQMKMISKTLTNKRIIFVIKLKFFKILKCKIYIAKVDYNYNFNLFFSIIFFKLLIWCTSAIAFWNLKIFIVRTFNFQTHQNGHI